MMASVPSHLPLSPNPVPALLVANPSTRRNSSRQSLHSSLNANASSRRFFHSASKLFKFANSAYIQTRSRNLRVVTTRCDFSGGAGLGPEDASALVLAFGLGLPCNVMECGDVIYQASLAHDHHMTATGAVILANAGAYLLATPGVAAGYWDMFVLSKIDRFFRKSYKKGDFVLRKKLGEGGFGACYLGTLAADPKRQVVIKRAKEFGDVEMWMNERVRRACPDVCANFLGAFKEVKPGKAGKAGGEEEIWLVWDYEGDSTFADVLMDRDFPYNIEEAVLGKSKVPVDAPRGPEREQAVARELMRCILTGVKQLHSIGIVHRDMKPENMIFNTADGRLKIIDLGAAADLRVGINYEPDMYLLDPRYAAPEEYIMSTQTPAAPPPPVAAALAPILWQMNNPDRFDMYSVGLIFLQLLFPSVRTEERLATFSLQYKKLNYNLSAWRKKLEARATQEGMKRFELLEENGGHGWELLQAMLRKDSRERISASAALAHPFFHMRDAQLLKEIRNGLFVPRPHHYQGDDPQAWVTDLMARSGTQEAGGFTEVSLQAFRRNERRRQKAQQKKSDSAVPLTTQQGGGLSGPRDNSWWNALETQRLRR